MSLGSLPSATGTGTETDRGNFEEVPAHSVYQLILRDVAVPPQEQLRLIPTSLAYTRTIEAEVEAEAESDLRIRGIKAHPREATDKYVSLLGIPRPVFVFRGMTRLSLV